MDPTNWQFLTTDGSPLNTQANTQEISWFCQKLNELIKNWKEIATRLDKARTKKSRARNEKWRNLKQSNKNCNKGLNYIAKWKK